MGKVASVSPILEIKSLISNLGLLVSIFIFMAEYAGLQSYFRHFSTKTKSTSVLSIKQSMLYLIENMINVPIMTYLIKASLLCNDVTLSRVPEDLS